MCAEKRIGRAAFRPGAVRPGMRTIIAVAPPASSVATSAAGTPPAFSTPAR